MNIVYKLALLWLFIIMFSCQNLQYENKNIKPNKAKKEILFMSDYFSDVEYIQLETTSECLIDRNPKIYVFDNYVISIARRQCFLFDRKTGKFIKKIGRYGRGPGEYIYPFLGKYIVNENTKKVYMGGGNCMLEYDLSDQVSAIPISSLSNVCIITDSLWVQSQPNYFGNNTNQLMFFNREKMIDSIPNYNQFSLESNHMVVISNEITFYRYNESAYYKNLFNDTLFKIVKTGIEPAWIFDLGNLQPPYYLRKNPRTLGKELNNYSQIHSIFEVDSYLFFSQYYYNADSVFLHDKNTHQTVLLDCGKERNKGFFNDIDGGLSFWPSYVNSQQELICVYEAFDFKENFNYSPQKVIKNADALEKFKKIATNIKEEDNPIIIIAKLKK